MLERDMARKGREYLESLGFLVFKYHGSIYGVTGFSDQFGVCPDGRAFFLEVKNTGKKLSPAQIIFLEEAREHNALADWYDSLEKLKNLMVIWKYSK